MKCETCGKNHLSEDHPHFKSVSKIKDDKKQTGRKHYPSAHEQADKAEKKKYPEGYQKLKKMIRSMPKEELLGHVNNKGIIEVSKRVPQRLRPEVAYHEKVEIKHLNNKKN